MSIITIRHSTGDRFTPEAATGMIGQTFDAKIENRVVGVGTVIAARVSADGFAVDLTVEWPDDWPVSSSPH